MTMINFYALIFFTNHRFFKYNVTLKKFYNIKLQIELSDAITINQINFFKFSFRMKTKKKSETIR